MAIRIRYKANNKEFGALMMSQQTQDLADQGANRGAQEARRLASSFSLPERYIASIRIAPGPTATLGGNPRRTSRVEAGFPFIEFGSGRKRPRPQGGRSPAYRVLGRTASKIGNPPDRAEGPS